VVFHVCKGNDFKKIIKQRKNYGETSPNLKTNIEAKLLLNQKNYTLKNNKVADIETDEIKKNVRSHFQNDIRGPYKRIRNQQQCGEQRTARDKLKIKLQVVWYEVGL